jgi:hypothetical protein
MHKTGTTAIQTLLGANREALLERGVCYPGPRDDHHVLAQSFTQQAAGMLGADKPPSPTLWQQMVEQIAHERRRVVLSSEFFSSARGDRPARLVADLGAGRTHILIGIRNTADSAVSVWQQTLKQGRISDIDRWATTVFPRDGRPPKDRSFADHWDLGAMVRRWADAAGPENVTVVVLDPGDRRRLPTIFEQLLDLEPGFLADQPFPITNRGMTASEAEFVRRLNVAVRGRVEWSDYRRIVRHGVIRSVVERRRPEPGEPRPRLPAWALDVTRAAGEKAAAEIRGSGVRVVGDLAELSAERPAASAAPTVLAVPVDLAVLAVEAAITAKPDPRARRMAEISGREMVRVLRRRLRKRARRSVRRLWARPGDAAS